ncbi:UVR8, partial [Symbiodinium sp. KB8]
EHVRQLSSGKRFLVDGYTSTASSDNSIYHTRAVSSDGQLVCFGFNCSGQCDVPTDLGAVVAASAGLDHTCAVRSDGQLVCFGVNGSGQCDVPTDLGAVVAVSAGVRHTCAVRSDGQLVCFGNNAFGQCDVPTDLGAVAAVSARDSHTCAVRSDGQLVCFGNDADGQCDVPTGLGAVVAVSAGVYHTCAVTSNGQLVCFGFNCSGQCDVPTDLGAVVAVSAGLDHTCAVRSDGQLVCFGVNCSGQCDVPTDLGAVVAVSAGVRHTCAVRCDGQLVCFGDNADGQCDVPTGLTNCSISRNWLPTPSEIKFQRRCFQLKFGPSYAYTWPEDLLKHSQLYVPSLSRYPVVTAQRDGGGNVVASDDDAHDANLDFLDCKNEISASYTIMMLTVNDSIAVDLGVSSIEIMSNFLQVDIRGATSLVNHTDRVCPFPQEPFSSDLPSTWSSRMVSMAASKRTVECFLWLVNSTGMLSYTLWPAGVPDNPLGLKLDTEFMSLLAPGLKEVYPDKQWLLVEAEVGSEMPVFDFKAGAMDIKVPMIFSFRRLVKPGYYYNTSEFVFSLTADVLGRAELLIEPGKEVGQPQ